MKNQTWWVGGAVLLVVVAVAVRFMWFTGPGPSSSSNDESVTLLPGDEEGGIPEGKPILEGKTVQAAGEMIQVEDQAAGGSVVISSVTVSTPSWVAIKDREGWILGAARVDSSRENVSVPLLRPTVAGGSYQALIYMDNGDKIFDHKVDALVTVSAVTPVWATFSAN